MSPRIRAFITHLTCSVAVAHVLAWLVFGVWYPVPLDKAVGVRKIFLLLLSVDAVLGPLVTLIVYKPGKKGLVMDLVIIVILQISALGYGLHTVAVGRPAWIVFNKDRFDVVRAYEVDQRNIERAPAQFRDIPWGKPRWVSSALPDDLEEQQSILAEVLEGGPDLPQRPEYFQPLEQARENIQQRMRPLVALEQFNSPAMVGVQLDSYESAAGWLPLMTNEEPMVVLLNGEQKVIGVVNLRPW